MKKWGILLGIVAVICIISEAVAESKRLEEPIILDVVMDFNYDRIYVSFLTNTKEPARIEWIDINGASYFPESRGFDMFNGGEVQPYSFMDVKYYSIYDNAIVIDDWNRQKLLAGSGSLEQVKIHFAGEEKAQEAGVLVIRPNKAIGILANGWENAEGKMTMSIIAEEALTLTDVALVNIFGRMEGLVKDGESVLLPVTLQEGEVLQAELEEIVGLYPFHQAYLRLSGTAGGYTFDEIRGSLINQSPSEEWVKERVEKHHE